MTARLSLGVALGALLVALPARADIVLHDGGVSRDREVADIVLKQVGQAPRMVLSGDVLAGPTRLLASNVEVEQCEGEPIALGLDRKREGIVEAVLSFELDRAIAELDILDTLLPCSSEPVGKDDLARLSFLRGAALLDQGKEPEARLAMRDAIAQVPTFDGLKGFPAPHTDLLNAVREEAKGEAGAALFVWHKPESVTSVVVDGAVVDNPEQTGAPVRSGRHLVQSRGADGRLRGMWVRTTGVSGVVVHPGAGQIIWEDGGRSPGGEMAMRLMLLTEFQGQDGDIHVLRFKGRRIVSAATYPADGGVRTPWEQSGEESAPAPEPVARPTREPAKPTRATPSAVRPSRVRFALGGGYQYVHPFNYGMVSADLGVRLVGPLTVTVFARPAYGGRFTVDLGEGEPVDGAIILVPFGAGLGIQKHDGPVGPFVFGAFQMAINQVNPLGSAMIGATIQGGADFAPGNGPFIIRVEGEAGILGSNNTLGGPFYAGFTARVGIGLGARF